MPHGMGSWPEDINEVLRHLSSLEIDLDDYEIEVECIQPMTGTPHGSHSASISRTLDIDDHPEIHKSVVTLVKAVKQAMRKPDPEYQPNRCDKCVNADCCHFERIFLTKDEAKVVLDHLGEPVEHLEKYFRRERDLAGHYDLVFRHEDGHCRFLKKSGAIMRCTIYEARPRVCREYNAAVCDECEEELE